MAEKKSKGAGWLVLLGGAAAAGLYFLLKPAAKIPGRTEAAPLPKIEAPLAFQTLGAVATRFDDVLTLYRTGRLAPAQAIREADALVSAVQALRARGIGEPMSAAQLLSRIGSFVEDAQAYAKSQGVPA